MSSRFQKKKAKRLYLETSRLGKTICANRHCTSWKAEKFIVCNGENGKQFTIQVCEDCLHLFDMEKTRQEPKKQQKQEVTKTEVGAAMLIASLGQAGVLTRNLLHDGYFRLQANRRG